MKILRRKHGHPPPPHAAHDPDLAAAQAQASESARRAERDLAYQQAMAHQEQVEIAVPLRRFRTEVNHIAELIAESLAPRQQPHKGDVRP